MKWLNVVGIILNFIAAFLIAPELIGIDRIRKLEKDIKNWAFRRTERVYRYQRPIRPFLALLYKYFPTRSRIVIGLFETLLVYLATYWIFFSPKSNDGWILLLVMLVLFYLQAQLSIIKLYKRERDIRYLILGFIMAVFTAPLVFLAALVLPVLYIPILLIQSFGKIALCYSQFMLRILVGENKIRTAIIIIGTALFVLGSIFQLIAAF